MKKKILLYYFIFFILACKSLYALEIDETSSNISILEHAKIYVDKTGQLSKEKVLEQEFIKAKKSTLGFGFDSQQVVWIELELTNITDQGLHKVLEFATPVTEELTLYDGDQIFRQGSYLHTKKKESLHPSFELYLEPKEIRKYYIKADSHYVSLLITLKLWEREAFIRESYEHKIVLFAFLAGMLVLLVYNLMLWIFSKEKAYLYYVFYLVTVIFFQMTYSGMTSYYLDNPDIYLIIQKFAGFYIGLLVFSIVLFTREFLDIKKFPQIDKVFVFYLYTTPIVGLFGYSGILYDLHAIIFYMPLGLFVVFTGFYVLNKGVKQAKFYVLGWSMVILSLFVVNFKTLGIADIGFVYINELAFLLEALLFSIALAHKIKLLEEEKQRANEQVIELQNIEQERLTQLVDEKTHDLHSALEHQQLLYRELNHRVKNNLQMILSLVKLQIRKSDKATKQALDITKNRLHSFANMYELLHVDNQYSKIDALSYFENIVHSIAMGSEKDIEVAYQIEVDLDMDKLIYCGLIVNELVTNAYKYAFKKSGRVSIVLKQKNDGYELIVSDNGVGYSHMQEDSLGLTIVRTLVEKQLFGTINIDATSGTRIVINWSRDAEHSYS